MLSRVVSQLSKLSTLLFWLQSFEILIGARLSGQYNLEKQTQQTEANDSFGPEGQEVLDMFLFLGKCLHSCCLISQLIITIIRFIFVFLWELLRSKHSMTEANGSVDRSKAVLQANGLAHIHTLPSLIILYIHIAYIYILLYIAYKTRLALYFSLIHLYHRAFWSCIEGASFGQSPVARWQTHPEVRRLHRCATSLKIIDSSSGPWSQPAHIQFCQ